MDGCTTSAMDASGILKSEASRKMKTWLISVFNKKCDVTGHNSKVEVFRKR